MKQDLFIDSHKTWFESTRAPHNAQFLVHAIGRQTGLELDDHFEISSHGSGAVYLFDQGPVVKIFNPMNFEYFLKEQLFYEHPEWHPAGQVPTLLAQGELRFAQSWKFIVLSRVEGQAASDVWHGLDPGEKRRLSFEIQEALQELHRADLEPPPGWCDWGDFVRRRVRELAVAPESTGLPRALAQQIPGWLEAHPPRMDSMRCLLHCDVKPDHVFLAKRDGRWRFSGLIDFGDIQWGDPAYDLVLPQLSFSNDDFSFLTPMAHADTTQLRVYGLLHRFPYLNHFAGRRGKLAEGSCLDELLAELFPQC